MATDHSSDQGEQSNNLLVAFRPLLFWIPISVLLLAYNYHRINVPKTKIVADVLLNGETIISSREVAMRVDGQDWPLNPQLPIPVGNHRIEIFTPESTTYRTNLFVWYGENHLGEINLERLTGDLHFTLSPQADILKGFGDHAVFHAFNVSNLRTNLPVGEYTIELRYGDRTERHKAKVEPNQLIRKSIYADFGVVELSSNVNPSQFSLNGDKESDLYSKKGDLPQRLTIPVGSYTLSSWIGDYRKESSLTVNQGKTNTIHIVFEYGTFNLITKPSATSVIKGRKRIGNTPLEMSMQPGTHQIRLEKDGYVPVSFPITVTANQAVTISTNLVHRGYLDALQKANREVNRGRFSQAIGFFKEALAIDPDATELRERIKEYEVVVAKQAQEQKISNLRRNANELFKSVTSKFQHAELFDTYHWTFQKEVDQVKQATRKVIDEGPVNYSVESAQDLGNGSTLFIGAVKGFRAMGKRCAVLVTEIQPKQIEVRAKFWDFVTGRKITLSLSGIDPSSLVPVHERYFKSSERAAVNQRRKQTAEQFRAALQNQLK